MRLGVLYGPCVGAALVVAASLRVVADVIGSGAPQVSIGAVHQVRPPLQWSEQSLYEASSVECGEHGHYDTSANTIPLWPRTRNLTPLGYLSTN